MVSGKALFICFEPQEIKWQLPPKLSGKLSLVGWRASSERAKDAGVPEAVIGILARSLTSIALVSFPSSTKQDTSSNDFVLTMAATGLGSLVRSVFSRTPMKFLLISTRRPEVASCLFDDPGFPWWMQGQVILLSSPDLGPPIMDWQTLLSLIDLRRPVDFRVLVPMGISAAIYPGVDGDLAGIFSDTEERQQEILGSLERAANLAGFDWKVVSETSFADELSA